MTVFSWVVHYSSPRRRAAARETQELMRAAARRTILPGREPIADSRSPFFSIVKERVVWGRRPAHNLQLCAASTVAETQRHFSNYFWPPCWRLLCVNSVRNSSIDRVARWSKIHGGTSGALGGLGRVVLIVRFHGRLVDVFSRWRLGLAIDDFFRIDPLLQLIDNLVHGGSLVLE